MSSGVTLASARSIARKVYKSSSDECVLQVIRAAFHEAGHAVVARKLGLPVRHLLIDQNPALTRFPEGAKANPDDLVLLTMAGPIAESVILDKPVWIENPDRQMVQEDMIGALYCRRTFHRRTRKLVVEHWPTINAVASELLQVGRISGEQLDAIITRSRVTGS